MKFGFLPVQKTHLLPLKIFWLHWVSGTTLKKLCGLPVCDGAKFLKFGSNLGHLTITIAKFFIL